MPQELELALEAAQKAGRLVREHANSAGATRTKSTAIDLVSETDIASGVEVVKTIVAKDPGARFVVEEDEVYELTGAEKGDLRSGEPVWVVDPIDGTTSFLHGYPCFSVSIALLRDGQPVVGVVRNVALDQTNWATAGGGAFQDGRELHASTERDVRRAVLVTGFPYDRTNPLELQLATLSAFLRHPVQDIRRDGSAAIDCCNVASGICDGYWEYALKTWDVAAGVLMCREAGARITDVYGEEWTTDSTSVCTADPALHEAMREIIADAIAPLLAAAR